MKKVEGAAGENLVVKISRELVEKISQGAFVVGDKLPSESQLAAQYSVSRTVVREAIASLRSGGIVETRQGAGAFVARLPGEEFEDRFKPVNLEKASSVMEALEMRLAVEAEAASFAAERRSPVQAARIMEALEEFRQAVEAGEDFSILDFQFHMEVAKATNNNRFPEFLTLMEAAISPRSQLDGPLCQGEHFRCLYAEHKAVADAIFKGEPQAAREAMRRHILATLERYAEKITL